jgi:hypothetical protein
MFWKKKAEKAPVAVEPTILEKLLLLEGRISRLEAETLDLMSAQLIIRNKVLRKIQSKTPPPEEEKEPSGLLPTQSLNRLSAF